MKSARACAAGALCLLAVGCSPRVLPDAPVPATAAARANEAVLYLEKREGGRTSTRALKTARDAFNGIDINSRVDIRIDRDLLRQRVAARPELAARREQLSRRVEALRDANEQLGLAAQLTRASTDAFANDTSSFVRLRSQMARLTLALQDALVGAIAARMTEAGQSASAADESAAAIMNETFEAQPGSGGVSWAVMGRLFDEEIRHLERTIEALPTPGIALEVRAYQIGRAKDARAVPLRNYNAIQPGAPVREPKLRFDVPPAEAQLYASYDSLAREIAVSRSAGEAAVAGLKAQVSLHQPELQSALNAAELAVRQLRGELGALSDWTDRERLESWLASVHTALQPEVRSELRAALDDVSRNFDATVASLTTLAELAGIRQSLVNQPADIAFRRALALIGRLPVTGAALGQAFDSLAWAARTRSIEQFLARTHALGQQARARVEAPDGPVPAFRRSLEASRIAGPAVARATRVGVATLQALFDSRGAVAAADLVVPEGQQRPSIEQDLDTFIDLPTLPGGRSEGDRIEVQFLIYENDQVVDQWKDELEVQSYGLSGRAMASLSFARRRSDTNWQPLPALSWIMRYRNWPADLDPGLRPPRWSFLMPGVGLSTMSLDFDENQDVEVGVAVTGSLLEDRILAGYGWNLQTGSRRAFWFFALRLFNAPGVMGQF